MVIKRARKENTMEKFIALRDSKYNEGVQLEEYNGSFSLVTAREAEGKVYLKWGFPQTKDRKPLEKSIPWKVTIGGSKEEAIEMLKTFMLMLAGQEYPPDESEIPF